MQFPEPAAGVLERLAAELPDLLGPNLVGLYVYGSLAFGCYNPARSDIDVLAVTRRRIAHETRGPLANLLSGLHTKIEISFLSRADLEPWRYPTPYDFHFGSSEGAKEDGEGKYFAAEIVNARTRGVALIGPPPAETLPAVPENDFLDCLAADLRWARENYDSEGPVYGILNCCRILAYRQTGEIMSKAEGGEWAARELADFRPLIERAVLAYRDEPRDDCAHDRDEVLAFFDWTERSL
jgi:predicted nucleotidyltransferase